MPTPFYHISVAEAILVHPTFPENTRRLLQDHSCSFLLGSTAPDVQVVSGQHRRDTHFFTIPISTGASLPWVDLLREYPALADPSRLPPDQTAFICGYLCHLLADWEWIQKIYSPIFSPSARWLTHPRRSHIHNIVRTYLDRLAIQSLSGSEGYCLDRVQPAGYLPFTSDAYLCEWRDFIAKQLLPGGEKRTVEVFARRAGLDPHQFTQILESDELMEREVFSLISRQQLDRFRSDLIEMSTSLSVTYLSGGLTSA